MRLLRLMLVATSISIIGILCCGLVFALNPDEVSVSPSWSTPIHYQGDNVSVKLILTSNSSDELRIYFIGLHFDWMASDSFAGRDLSADPVVIPSFGTHVFEPMAITIPANVSAGLHSYFIGLEGTQGTSFISFSWDSSSRMMQILDSNSKVFYELQQQVASKIGKADNATYESVEAQSLLEQAKNEYAQAFILAGQEKWVEAVSSLQNASSYVEQAEAAEQLSAEQSTQQQQLLLYIAVIVIIVVVVAVIAVIWRKMRKMIPKVKRPPLKEELTISGVTFSVDDTVEIVVDNSGTKDFAIAEVWINNEEQAFATAPPMERVPPNESVHVYVTYAYSKGASYNIKIVSDRKKIYLVTATTL